MSRYPPDAELAPTAGSIEPARLQRLSPELARKRLRRPHLADVAMILCPFDDRHSNAGFVVRDHDEPPPGVPSSERDVLLVVLPRGYRSSSLAQETWVPSLAMSVHRKGVYMLPGGCLRCYQPRPRTLQRRPDRHGHIDLRPTRARRRGSVQTDTYGPLPPGDLPAPFDILEPEYGPLYVLCRDCLPDMTWIAVSWPAAVATLPRPVPQRSSRL